MKNQPGQNCPIEKSSNRTREAEFER